MRFKKSKSLSVLATLLLCVMLQGAVGQFFGQGNSQNIYDIMILTYIP